MLDDDTVETLSARILEEEHRIYSEAIRIVIAGKYRVDGRRVVLTKGLNPRAAARSRRTRKWESSMGGPGPMSNWRSTAL